MANVSVFSVSGGVTDVLETAMITAGAAEQTVPMRKDSRMALRVANGGEAAAVVRIAAGDGPRAPLGAKDVTVGAGETAYIALFDTARHKSGNEVNVSLVDDDGDTLGAPALAALQIEAVQL